VVGLGKTPAGIAGLLVVVQPVVAAAAAWLLFSEPLTIIQICGAMLILSGIWLVQQGRPTTKTYTVD
ncbi:MAG: EamA family transporter, partial [Hyphomonadaceae bacterium]|nr:EamA family transporter [Hyphomonadaceae bacterium]